MTQEKKKKQMKFQLCEETAMNLLRFFKENFEEHTYNSAVMSGADNFFRHKVDLVEDLKQNIENFNQNMTNHEEVKISDRKDVFRLVQNQHENVLKLKPFIYHLYNKLEKEYEKRGDYFYV